MTTGLGMGLVAAWHFSFLCLQLDRIESIFSILFCFPALEKRTLQCGGKYSPHHLHVGFLLWCGGIIVIDASFHSRKRRISLDFSCRFTLRFMVRDATRLRTVFHEIHMLFLVIRSEQNANTQIRYFSMMLVLCAYGCRATPSQLEKSMLACLGSESEAQGINTQIFLCSLAFGL